MLAGEAETPVVTPVLPSSRRGWQAVLAILILALGLRVGLVAATHYTPLTDAIDYDRIATSIASGHGYGNAILPPARGPSALRAPGYPFALSIVYRIFGTHDWTAGRIENAVIGTIVVGLIGLVAAQLFGRKVGLIALGVAAISPQLILIGSGLQLEPLLVALSFAALAAGLQHRRHPRGLLWPVVAAVLIGLTALTREIGFILILPIAWLFWTGGGQSGRQGVRRFSRAQVGAPLVVVALSLAVISPWTIRNAFRVHAFDPVTTSSGFGLAGTYNETSVHNKKNPAEWIPPYNDPTDAKILTDMHDPSEVKVDRALRKASIDVVRAHPVYPVRVAFWNTERMFDLDRGHYSLLIAQYLPYPHSLTRLAVYSSYIILLLAIVGAFKRETRRAPLAVWAIPVLAYVFIVVFLPASIRYRASIEPFFILLASVALAPIIDWLFPSTPKA